MERTFRCFCSISELFDVYERDVLSELDASLISSAHPVLTFFQWHFFFLFCLFFWLHQVLVEPCGIFDVSRGTAVVARGLQCAWASVVAARGILVPRPGIEPVSPALQGTFLTTGPPGKSRQ